MTFDDHQAKPAKAKAKPGTRPQAARKEAIDELRATLLEPVTVHRIRRPKGSSGPKG